ncbi:hypothetical protein HYFRA_00003185 [Hymenoscyphus fraxineus]|uniref:Carboxylic ester hydrolase n=1 Tax=Hymenoscyphus fraxineus TaxID=746836 RepID=A0A9N9KVQ5_9HELO|nr:hypothetical protein HYFRA_00003185 [Hymenoscyphus fraxineus]
MVNRLARALLVLVSLSLVFAETESSNLQVKIADEGEVEGIVTDFPVSDNLVPGGVARVRKFLGVPFAAPPERFAPPAPARPWKGLLKADRSKPACIQQFNYPKESRDFATTLFNNPAPEESEDCLYLNIFAPTTTPPPGGFPVIFWVYGGSLLFGYAGHPMYDGSGFAGVENVILVTANYRTNVFGFPSSSELPLEERNLGFLDQRMALEWTSKHISSFGGDPAKITLAGESAGALSVDALVTTYPDRAPFRAAIMQSGQISVLPNERLDTTPSWATLAAELNCSTTASNLTCIREAPALVIKDIVEKKNLSWVPAYDNKTTVRDPVARRAARRIAQVPILVGTNNDEGSIYTRTQKDFPKFVNDSFGFSPPLVEAIKATFTGYSSDLAASDALFTHYIFQCTQALHAQNTIDAGSSVYRYYFNTTFPNNSGKKAGFELGVYHSSEIPLMFGTYDRQGATDQQIALSRFMQKAWADFAKDPELGPGWPKLGSSGQDLAVLGLDGSSGATMANQTIVDSKCALFRPLYEAIRYEAKSIRRPNGLEGIMK